MQKGTLLDLIDVACHFFQLLARHSDCKESGFIEETQMPRIVGISTAIPPYVHTQKAIKAFAKDIFKKHRALDHLMPVFDNAMVEKRHFVVDQKWLESKHDFTDVNELYIKCTIDLAVEAVTDLANKCLVNTKDFDAIFFISTTGLATPSIDAHLFNRLDLSPHIKRIPIWGLGCAGGAGAISRAYDYLKAYPNHRVLIVDVELCSLAFQKDDLEKSNIVSTAIFADGAAACLLVGDQVEIKENKCAHPEILGTYSTIYPDTLNVMSWQITSEGFKVHLSKDIPSIVNSLVKGNITEFLSEYKMSLKDMHHFVMHPGGMKVLYAYADGLGINMEALHHSVLVLREYGNMSSATILFILKRFMENTVDKSGDFGLLSALGPGFSSELLLLKWS